MVHRLVISGANIRVNLSPEEKQRAQWSPQQLAGHLRDVANGLPPWFLPDYSRVSPDGPEHWGGMAFFDNSFAKQRDYFATYRTVVGIDQRGYGHSPDGPWSLSYRMMADDTAAVLERLGLGPVDVVGHSDGANLALILARDHPQMVHRLVISGANIRVALSPEEKTARSMVTSRIGRPSSRRGKWAATLVSA
jgi:pimeloyl-ACP methyl ester carboxylesterase